ncbi:MAG: trypsin-like peptidase domain-containing protein [Desulfovibrio sp.]|jgi:S1-C subfamily serine protease|nr:trypsin-like peptidase domain-containing protein [Desulfovibrio sp.]
MKDIAVLWARALGIFSDRSAMKTFCRVLLFCICCAATSAGAATVANGQEKLDSAALFKKVSPSVVLLIGKDSFGSGSIVNETDILTNWHVVARDNRIVVAFKPREEGAPIDPDEFMVGDVIKKAPGKDLALVRIKRIPKYVTPVALGALSELEIGADVHAIGHPQGGIWTYTKGVISQLRKNFEWRASSRERFKADVIQTQTPINPGNSGGPLLSDRGHLVGVNSFKTKDAEGLNFAVSLSEILRFLDTVPTCKPAQPEQVKTQPQPGREPQKNRAESGPKNEPRKSPELTYQGRDKANSGYLRVYTADSTDTERIYYYPDDQALPGFCFRMADGVTEAVTMDMDRDGKWDYSILDRDRSGKFESAGLHPNGKLAPSSFLSLKDKKIPAKVKTVMPKKVPEPGSHAVGSPSFDCARADTVIKQTICGSDRLAGLDVTISTLYSRVVQKRPAMQAQIAAGQKEWLRGTEAMCREGAVATCLEGRYKQRAIYLNVLMLQ